MTWGTKTMPPKKTLSRGPLVIGVTPTAVKQYVDLQPMGGRYNNEVQKCMKLMNTDYPALNP